MFIYSDSWYLFLHPHDLFIFDKQTNCVSVDNQYHSARIAAKSWERDQNDKGNTCQQYPEYKYLPNKPVVGRVWQPLTWLSVQYAVTGTPVKHAAQLSTQTQCAWCCMAPLCAEYNVTGTLVTLHSTKTAPCYFTFHQDTLLFYIPPRLNLVTLHSTKAASCYFTFQQDCILLFYIPTRMNTFWSSVTKGRFIIPKPVAPEWACLIARVHHNVTIGVGNYSNATDCTCVMFTPISIISQMIQTLKCGRQTGTQRSDKQTYFSFMEEK